MKPSLYVKNNFPTYDSQECLEDMQQLILASGKMVRIEDAFGGGT
jgi:hypothetical protein